MERRGEERGGEKRDRRLYFWAPILSLFLLLLFIFSDAHLPPLCRASIHLPHFIFNEVKRYIYARMR